MRFAVVVFPGSSGDVDSYHAIQDTIGESVEVEYVQHTEEDLSGFDCIILPGGASYGDYLRAGALARFSPVMQAVEEAVRRGVYVLGIGNGFQILLESGLLPGVMRPNPSLKFHSQQTQLVVTNQRTPFTIDYREEEVISMPIAHGTGQYECDERTLQLLQQNDQIVFRYHGENPNGSVAQIAGIVNEAGNVLGMMPHPERAVSALLGSDDGNRMFTSILRMWREKHGAAIR